QNPNVRRGDLGFVAVGVLLCGCRRASSSRRAVHQHGTPSGRSIPVGRLTTTSLADERPEERAEPRGDARADDLRPARRRDSPAPSTRVSWSSLQARWRDAARLLVDAADELVPSPRYRRSTGAISGRTIRRSDSIASCAGVKRTTDSEAETGASRLRRPR